jgi:ABC-type glutathione transport system ATPase component
VERIALIGNAGSGKSTLSQRLDTILSLPPNCPMLPKTWELAKIIRRFQTLVRPRLLELLDSRRGRLRIVHLRSPAETDAFLRFLSSG